jgi:ADP-heptose:LPS heptosyltransferase
MHEILVIRFGALGDLCLLGWTLARLEGAPVTVTLVTRGRLADLAGHLCGVDRVIALPEPGRLGDLLRLAGVLRGQAWDTVIDAHAVLRSRLLLGLLGRRPDVCLRKDTVARLRLLRGGTIDPVLARHMRDRFDALLIASGLPTGEATPPLVRLAGTAAEPAGTAPILGLAPGAQWDPKRWPAAHWAALVRQVRAVSGCLLRVFVGPREAAWFRGSELASALADADPVEVIEDRPLPEVATLLGACRLLVCNDSGLLHLAEAVGTPVVACFGPTVAAFGYTPTLPQSTVLEIADLDCRPCSRNGKRPCHRRDLACLVRLTPETVWRAVDARGPWREA